MLTVRGKYYINRITSHIISNLISKRENITKKKKKEIFTMMLKLMEKDEQEMEITRNKVKISKKNLKFMDKEAITLFYFILFSLYGL